ncbi:MAG: ATP-binding cassette domain-containing protein [Myxococcales bacterium]
MSERSIVVDHLRRTFGSFVAVDDVSFEVSKGEIFGYLGANGAGKSTTIRMLCGLLSPSGGQATVAGCKLGADTTLLRSRIGYMSQKFSLYLDLPVDANIEFFGGAYGLYGKALERRRDEILERTGLSELRKSTTAELPSGTRQRLALGTALLHHPQIVFLDEPTAGVDPAARRMFWTLIRELAREGTTVFVTTHYMDEAEYCARIGLMVSGRLVALDAPSALKAAWVPGRVTSIYGCELATVRALLAERPGVLAVESFGSKVHVRFDPNLMEANAIERIVGAACGEGGVAFEPAEVSLEDVFLAAVAQPVPPKQSVAPSRAAVPGGAP